MAKYSCDPGYILKGTKNTNNKRFCNPTKNGIRDPNGIKIPPNKWSGNKPLCSMYLLFLMPLIKIIYLCRFLVSIYQDCYTISETAQCPKGFDFQGGRVLQKGSWSSVIQGRMSITSCADICKNRLDRKCKAIEYRASEDNQCRLLRNPKIGGEQMLDKMICIGATICFYNVSLQCIIIALCANSF